MSQINNQKVTQGIMILNLINDTNGNILQVISKKFYTHDNQVIFDSIPSTLTKSEFIMLCYTLNIAHIRAAQEIKLNVITKDAPVNIVNNKGDYYLRIDDQNIAKDFLDKTPIFGTLPAI